MTISSEVHAQILRLHHAEKWPANTIASQLGVHHSVVERVLRQEGIARSARRRASQLDPFVDFIQESFKRYPRLCASRLFGMCLERGYRGSESHFRHAVRAYRPKKAAEAYLRLKTLPGEQAQVDWGDFGTIEIGRAQRRLSAFVMVLSYSRRIFLRFYLNQKTESFLHGHQAAWQRWNGLVRVVLYDNLKSCVLERRGDAIRFHSLLLDFSGHYRYEPRPVAVARGNEKGRVERAISYIRKSFFAARPYRDLDDLNRMAQQWCEGLAMDRPWPEDKRFTVREAFAREAPLLLSLPATPFEVDERCEVSVGKTPYVRFDCNDYSVPHESVRCTAVVLASLEQLRILDEAGSVIARHERCYGKREVIENAEHVQRLVREKRRARAHRAVDRLSEAAPSTQDLLRQLAERGEPLGAATKRLLVLLDEYGSVALEAAITEALKRGVPHEHAVRQVLERERLRRGQLPGLVVRLPDDPRVRDLSVEPHALEPYDELGSFVEEDDEDNKNDENEEEVKDDC